MQDNSKVAGIIAGSGAISGAVGSTPFGPVSPDHPNYAEIKAAYNARDGGKILRLIEPMAAVRQAVAATPTGGRVTIQNRMVYFDGKPTDHGIGRRILQLLDGGWDIMPMARLLERLMKNPSMRAVRDFYPTIERLGLAICEDGLVLGYKAVRSDWLDWNSGTVSNAPGTVVEMPRNTVDDDWGVACSHGYHVGSIKYLASFHSGQGRRVMVEFDPADFVAGQPGENKFRVCKYRVVAEFLEDPTTWAGLPTTSVYATTADDVTLARPPAVPVPVPAAVAEEDAYDDEEDDDLDDDLDDEEDDDLDDDLDEDEDDDLTLDDLDDDDDDDERDEDDDDEPPHRDICYRYLVTACPKCRNDLQSRGGVTLELSFGVHSKTLPSRLDQAGWLQDTWIQDTPNGDVAAGNHSETRCGRCDLVLTPWEQKYDDGEFEFGPNCLEAVELPDDLDAATPGPAVNEPEGGLETPPPAVEEEGLSDALDGLGRALGSMGETLDKLAAAAVPPTSTPADDTDATVDDLNVVTGTGAETDPEPAPVEEDFVAAWKQAEAFHDAEAEEARAAAEAELFGTTVVDTTAPEKPRKGFWSSLFGR